MLGTYRFIYLLSFKTLQGLEIFNNFTDKNCPQGKAEGRRIHFVKWLRKLVNFFLLPIANWYSLL